MYVFGVYPSVPSCRLVWYLVPCTLMGYTPVCLWGYAYRVCPLHALMGCVPCTLIGCVPCTLIGCVPCTLIGCVPCICILKEALVFVSSTLLICHRSSDVGPAPNTPRTWEPSFTALLHSTCALCPYPWGDGKLSASQFPSPLLAKHTL